MQDVGEEDIAEAVLGHRASGKGVGSERCGAIYLDGGGGGEGKLRANPDTGKIDGVDDNVGAIGDDQCAEAKANGLRGKREIDVAGDGVGNDAGAGGRGDGEVAAGSAIGDRGDAFDGDGSSVCGTAELLGIASGAADIDGSEDDGAAGGEALGEGGRRAAEGEGRKDQQEERGAYRRERESELARVSFAQRDSHHSSNKGR